MNEHYNFVDRDFLSLRDQSIEFLRSRLEESGVKWSADPSDIVYVLMEALAYMGDTMSYYVDRAAMESNVLTAQNPTNVEALARMFGYSPSLMRGASVTANATNSGSQNTVIEDGNEFLDGANNVWYADLGDTVLSLPAGSSLPVVLRQGKRVYEDLPFSTGKSNMIVPLRERNVDAASLAITVGNVTTGDTYYYTEFLDTASPEEKVFTAYLAADGGLNVQFGDGVHGAVPAAKSSLTASYKICNGSSGNGVKVGDVLRPSASWDDPDYPYILANVTLTASSNSFGGRDYDSTEDIRSKVVAISGTNNRAVTKSDYASVALSVPRVQRTSISATVWSRPVVHVYNADIAMMEEGESKDSAVRDLRDSVLKRLVDIGLIGVTPTVEVVRSVVGVPMSLRVSLWPGVIRNQAEKEIRTALSAAYDQLEFNTSLSSSSVLTALSRMLPPNIVQHAHVEDFLIDPNKIDVWYTASTSNDIPHEPGALLAGSAVPTAAGKVFLVGNPPIVIGTLGLQYGDGIVLANGAWTKIGKILRTTTVTAKEGVVLRPVLDSGSTNHLTIEGGV